MDTFGKINLSRLEGRQPSPLLFAGLCRRDKTVEYRRLHGIKGTETDWLNMNVFDPP
jgi:hypothetical protein